MVGLSLGADAKPSLVRRKEFREEPLLSHNMRCCFPTGLDAFPLALPTRKSLSGFKQCVLTSLLNQRRGKEIEFPKIQASRNQHAIHHRCPQLSTTLGLKNASIEHPPSRLDITFFFMNDGLPKSHHLSPNTDSTLRGNSEQNGS